MIIENKKKTIKIVQITNFEIFYADILHSTFAVSWSN